MPNRNLKKLRADANSVTFADPLDPAFTIRFKTAQASKTIDGLRLSNFVTEIIANDSKPVTVGSKTVNEPVSVRVKSSSSPESMTRTAAILKQIASQIDQWVLENYLTGFEVVTLPQNPGTDQP